MFRNAVFLGIFLIITGCQLKPAATHMEPPDSPHVHVHPLPGLPEQTAHTDYHLVYQDEALILENTNGTAAQYTDFAISHGQRVHVMIIDPSLTDYHHLHPTRLRDDDMAIYPIDFNPALAGEYRIFADITPKNDGKQRFLSTVVDVPGTPTRPRFQALAAGNMQRTGQADSLLFETHLDKPLRAGQPVMLNITVKNEDGQLFRELEPLMQAFAHLIGFSEDLQTILHAHPIGRDVTAENARGGPNLVFNVTFPKPGYYRLFLQVRVHDAILTLPIDARVAP